ncbi:pentapeptide repeat-containing protein [Streptomyces sp. NPDC090994]|uniref:pentapeptide repeat-containing protein n=1 Tax=Streptomyces sp. NPDC090994 TaxID=3365969 RepID=UPI003825A362
MRFSPQDRISRRHRRAAFFTLTALTIAGILLLALGPASWLIAGDTVRRLPDKEKADAINAVRQTILGAVAGAAVLGGLVITARTYQLSKRGQVTERFANAISLLASEKIEERLGAVYSLEHVLRESAQDHLTVVNLLANFVRERTRPRALPNNFPNLRSTRQDMPPFGTEPDADVEAALRVLAVRPNRPEPFRIDLRHASLPGIYLRDFEFSDQPSLSLAFFTWADLRASAFHGMDFTRAIFTHADMRECLLMRTKLDGASLSKADLRKSSWQQATLVGAFLDGADLRGCETLTAEQLSTTWIDEETKLPSHLENDVWVLARLAACRSSEGPRPVPPATPRPRSDRRTDGL